MAEHDPHCDICYSDLSTHRAVIVTRARMERGHMLFKDGQRIFSQAPLREADYYESPSLYTCAHCGAVIPTPPSPKGAS